VDRLSAVPPRLTPLREMQLVEDHRRGDPEAIAELLQAYQRRIYGVCMRMMGEEDSARDLTQETLVKVLEGLEGYDGRARLSTWIVRIAMNCCLSELRRRKVRRRHVLGAGPAGEPGSGSGTVREAGHAAADLPAQAARSPSGHLAARELAPAEGVEQAETAAALIRALATLDPEMRAVLVLRDLQDLDYQQIGVVLGIPVGTVKSRLFRARLAMRAALEAPGRGSG
jgi:RNA polymerase sigma-70 factor (ECF subfamily)